MTLFGGMFGGKSSGKTVEDSGYMMPSELLAKEFGKVNVKKVGSKLAIDFTILMEPIGSGSEGWQTGVALDASASMQGPFGRLLIGAASAADIDKYTKMGWVKTFKQDGQLYRTWDNRATEEMLRRGVFRYSDNEVEPRAREMTAYLARNLDSDGGTTVIYWACGDGSQVEVVGDFSAEQCASAEFSGPTKIGFGNLTHLAPAVKYFADRFSDAKNGMYVFITDGELNDLEQVKKYTIELCRDIESKKRNPMKCILIGLGDKINEDQMEQLDDLDSGTDVDVWDHKIAKTMRDLKEIFAEVVDSHQIITTNAQIFDDSGNLVKTLEELHAKELFEMPATSKYFILDVSGTQIKQTVEIKK